MCASPGVHARDFTGHQRWGPVVVAAGKRCWACPVLESHSPHQLTVLCQKPPCSVPHPVCLSAELTGLLKTAYFNYISTIGHTLYPSYLLIFSYFVFRRILSFFPITIHSQSIFNIIVVCFEWNTPSLYVLSTGNHKVTERKDPFLLYVYYAHQSVLDEDITIYSFFSFITASVHLPRIGHATKGFNWYGTERLIRKHLAAKGIPTSMYPFVTLILCLPSSKGKMSYVFWYHRFIQGPVRLCSATFFTLPLFNWRKSKKHVLTCIYSQGDRYMQAFLGANS